MSAAAMSLDTIILESMEKTGPFSDLKISTEAGAGGRQIVKASFGSRSPISRKAPVRNLANQN